MPVLADGATEKAVAVKRLLEDLVARALRRCLATTNLAKSSNAGMPSRTRPVTHWQDGKTLLRWAAAAYPETEQSLRCIMGCRDLWVLESALRLEHTRVDAANVANHEGPALPGQSRTWFVDGSMLLL